MFTRKDKRLSSARKRLMSQLGKKTKRLRRFSEKYTESQTMPLHRTTCQAPSKEPTLKDESATTGGCGLAQPETIEVGDLLLGSDSVPPSSDSEYFPTPEKR